MQIAMTMPDGKSGGVVTDVGAYAARQDMLQAISTPHADLNKLAQVEDPQSNQTLKTNVKLALTSGAGGQLITSFTKGMAPELAFAAQDSIERLTKVYLSRGDTETTAIDKAVKAATSAWDFDADGNYRVPRGSLQNAVTLTRNAAITLKPTDIVAEKFAGSEFKPEEIQQQAYSRIQSTLQWRNNPAGTGLVAVYQPTNLPVYRPVILSGNKLLEVTNAQIKAGGAPIESAVPLTSGLDGLM
jgi:hypothetical protein